MSGPLGSSQWMYQAGEDYTIDQSLRFEDGNSAYLHWTPPSASNRRTWTFSCWLKRGNLTRSNIFNQQVNNANIMSLEIIDGDAIQFKENELATAIDNGTLVLKEGETIQSLALASVIPLYEAMGVDMSTFKTLGSSTATESEDDGLVDVVQNGKTFRVSKSQIK